MNQNSLDFLLRKFIIPIVMVIVVSLAVGGGVAIWEVSRDGWSPKVVELWLVASASIVVLAISFESFYRTWGSSPMRWDDKTLDAVLREWAQEFGSLLQDNSTVMNFSLGRNWIS